MTAGFWKCPACESLNPSSAATCQTCSPSWEPEELAGTTHLRHLAASLANKRRWRIASSGLGYVVVAARSQDIGEAEGAQLLRQNALADQTVTVTEVRRRGWLVYVRSALTPYPSALKPWQTDTTRSAALRPPAPRDPVEGRAYIGRVLEWSGATGAGSIRCADWRIGNVPVRRSDLSEREEAGLRAGQHVSFVIKKTPEGPFAVGIIPLGPSAAAG